MLSVSDISAHSTRRVFICQTSTAVSVEFQLAAMLGATKADMLYYKPYGDGVLVLLKFAAGNKKRHSTIDNCVVELDKFLMEHFKTSSTSFVSVSDIGSGKVRSFSGMDRLEDYLFLEIFDVMKRKQNNEYCLCNGVKKFSAATQAEEERARDRAQAVEDLRKQDEVMEADPDAFRGSTMLGGGSKMMMMAVDSVASAVEGTVVDGVAAIVNITGECVNPAAVRGLEEALAVERLRVEEAVAAKFAVENELLSIRSAAEDAFAAKTAAEDAARAANEALARERRRAEQAEAAANETLNVKAAHEALARERRRAEQAEALVAEERRRAEQAEALVAEERRRAEQVEASVAEDRRRAEEEAASALARERLQRERAEATRAEAIAGRNETLLRNAEVERQLNEARAQIEGFPATLAEALRRKHEHYEREGAATVRAELEKRAAALQEFHKRETDKLVQGMLHDAQKQVAPLQLRLGAMEVEVRNLKAQAATAREELRVATRELSDARRTLKQLQKKRAAAGGGDGGGDEDRPESEDNEAIASRLADAAEIERLHAQLRGERERADAAESARTKAEASLQGERRRRVEEAIAAKAAMVEAVQAAVVKERNDALLPKMAEMQRELSARVAEERAAMERQVAAQKAAHDDQIRAMLQAALEAETRCQTEVDRLSDGWADARRDMEAAQQRAAAAERAKGELRIEVAVLRRTVEEMGQEVAGERQKAAGLARELEEERQARLQSETDAARTAISAMSICGDGGPFALVPLGSSVSTGADNSNGSAAPSSSFALAPLGSSFSAGEGASNGIALTLAPDQVVVLPSDASSSSSSLERQLQAERLRADRAVHDCAEALRMLEAERARNSALERQQAAAAGPSSAAAEKQRADNAERSAREQSARAARAERERDEVRTEMAQRIDGAGVCLGDYHAAWQECYAENKGLRARAGKAERLRQEADLKLKEAKESEERAWCEVATLQGELGRVRSGAASSSGAPGGTAELVSAMEEAEQNFQFEAASRRAAESKLAQLEIRYRASKDRTVQLQASLREVESRAAELASVMRSGPFMFGGRRW